MSGKLKGMEKYFPPMTAEQVSQCLEQDDDCTHPGEFIPALESEFRAELIAMAYRIRQREAEKEARQLAANSAPLKK